MSNSVSNSDSSIKETSILREAAKDLISEKQIIHFDPQCIRKKCNWSSVKNQHKLDNPAFDTEFFLNDIKNNSPKLDVLLKKIRTLDARDEKKYGKTFKHFIFSDIKSGGQGAKMLASALLATGWNLGYTSKMKGGPIVPSYNGSNSGSESFPISDLVSIGKATSKGGEKKEIKWSPLELRSPSDLLKTRGNNFYLLSSVSVFDKPISVKMKKEILRTFNSRPENIYGDLARIIIMDSGFKEGIDLFDIKYVHIFEPSLNGADQKQVIGRGTRTCGQKGLEFHPTRGWPLEVFVYDLEIPEPLRASLLNSSTAQELLMKAMNADIRLANFGYDIERLSVLGSVDYELNRKVHSFSVDLEDGSEDEVIFGGAGGTNALHIVGGTNALHIVGGTNALHIVGGAHRKFGEKKGDVLKRKVDTFGHNEMKNYITENFSQYNWKDVKMENLCEEKKTGGASTAITYTPTQDFISHYFSPNAPVKGMLLNHSVGTGKCHAKDTPILMYDGSIKMVQDIQVGELLMGDNSTPRKVLSLATGEDDMYDIVPVKGDKYTVNSEHILCLKSTKLGIKNVPKQKNKPHVLNYINTETKKIVSKSFATREEAEEFQELTHKNNIMEIEVKDFLKLSKNVQKKMKGYRVPVEFPTKDVLLDPYFIGYWLGDDSKRDSVISSQDADVLHKFSFNMPPKGAEMNELDQLLCASSMRKGVKYMRDYAIENKLTFNDLSGYEYSFSGSKKEENKVLKSLQFYGLINNKHIPMDYKANDRDIRLQVLAGLIDSDGYYDTKGKCFEITQKNKTLTDDILFLCRSLGFAAYSKPCKKSCMYKGEKQTVTYWRTCISGAGLDEIPVKILQKRQTTRNINKNSLVSGITIQHIGRGQYYGFTLDGNNRYLLGDFTVTHNTCSAIATATANFEPNGYTILWVTRTTLKNDIWKNMFDQVCNESIRQRIANGEIIPDEQKERMKLLSKAWRIRPISYRQFSNLVSKQNAYYHRLVKENGEADPLRKTMLIIDEAHKLYGGGDLSSIERPDMDALHKSLMTSYAVSGADSVRLLLMTATPITVNPMEIVKLINLCKPIGEQIPSTFELFSDIYLNEDGTFTSKGEEQYLDDIAGHISYLNREKDARQFAQPIVKKVLVPIVSESQLKDVKEFDKFIAKSDAEAEVLKLKDEIEQKTEKIEGELKEMDKTRFQYLKEICKKQSDIPEKKCNTIVNKHITELVKEVKQYTTNIREQIKTIRNEIKDSSQKKRDVLSIIHQKIVENPILFARYKKSTYVALRTACSSKSISSSFQEVAKDIPQVAELDRQIQIDKEKIDMMKNKAKIDAVSFKLKLKQMKEMLKDRTLTELDRSVLESTIQSSKKEFRITQKRNAKILQEDIFYIKKGIKNTEKAKKTVFTKVRKTLKKIVRDKKKEEQHAKMRERNLRKSMRVEGALIDEIKDDIVNQFAEKTKIAIETDLDNITKEITEKEQKKIEKAEEKKKEREEEKTRKLRIKMDKKKEADLAKTRKAQEKAKAKAEAKAEEKAKKNAEKARKAKAKAEEKAKAKAEAKAEAEAKEKAKSKKNAEKAKKNAGKTIKNRK